MVQGENRLTDEKRKQIEEILLTDYGCFDDFTVDKLCDLFIVSKSVNCDDCNGEGERWSAYYSSYIKCDCKV